MRAIARSKASICVCVCAICCSSARVSARVLSARVLSSRRSSYSRSSALRRASLRQVAIRSQALRRQHIEKRIGKDRIEGAAVCLLKNGRSKRGILFCRSEILLNNRQALHRLAFLTPSGWRCHQTHNEDAKHDHQQIATNASNRPPPYVEARSGTSEYIGKVGHDGGAAKRVETVVEMSRGSFLDTPHLLDGRNTQRFLLSFT